MEVDSILGGEDDGEEVLESGAGITDGVGEKAIMVGLQDMAKSISRTTDLLIDKFHLRAKVHYTI